MQRICNLISSQIAFIVLFVAAIALLWPFSFCWMSTKCINWMLGVVMCGMGLNLKLDDFKVVFTRPKDVVVGFLAQFTIMPLLAWGLTRLFNLPNELAIGVILVGCCPGGTASNVITYLAKGDLALSVGITGMSTLAAPLVTPLLVYLLAGKSVDVDMLGMLMSIVQVVIVPIAIGLLVRHYVPKVAESISPYLPSVSTIAIAAIVGCIMSANSSRLVSAPVLIVVVVILHNVCGYMLGFLVGWILRLSRPKLTAISVEVGMQNSGLAVSLATLHFAMCPMATIPGALFSVWHNFSGAMLAAILNRIPNKNVGEGRNLLTKA